MSRRLLRHQVSQTSDLSVSKTSVSVTSARKPSRRSGRARVAHTLHGRHLVKMFLQGSRIRVCGPMLGMLSETSGLPDPLTEPEKDETSAQTADLF